MCFVLINFISIIKAWSDNTDKSEGYYILFVSLHIFLVLFYFPFQKKFRQARFGSSFYPLPIIINNLVCTNNTIDVVINNDFTLTKKRCCGFDHLHVCIDDRFYMMCR